MKRVWLWVAASVVLTMAWYVRPSSGASTAVAKTFQPSDLRTIEVSLPQSYGELRSVDRSSLYFENPDGTIHVVHLTLDGEVDQDIIKIVRR